MKLISKKKRKGFTLVELVVVVAIIAILAFIAAPKFASVTENAKVATFESNHDAVKTAIVLYMAENQGSLETDPFTGSLPPEFIKLIDGGANLDNKPVGSKYVWDDSKYVLTSTLEDISSSVVNDIGSGKRPGSHLNSGNKDYYVLEFNPSVTSN